MLRPIFAVRSRHCVSGEQAIAYFGAKNWPDPLQIGTL
jgi:hypothetical protein